MRSRLETLLFALFFLFSGMLIATLIIYFESPEELTVGKYPEREIVSGSSHASVSIVAVSSDGIGIVGKGSVEIKPGKGRVLFSTNPFVEPDTQYSIEVAKEVAEEVTGKALANQDVIYSIEAGRAELIGGPSAGAALCLATIAAIENKKVRSDVAITGTIQPNGSIGHVGAVLEKAQAAGKHGIKVFIVPKGQRNAIVYERKETEKRGPGFVFRRIYYEPKIIDLNEAMFEQYGMEVIEASNIYEAVELALEH
ncbi:MAG: hypothetical protein J7L44_01240 [Candidatus Diapherotrites archaeon]|nr:hypothetical protein [Candidatus Diapherotrites archaeon]